MSSRAPWRSRVTAALASMPEVTTIGCASVRARGTLGCRFLLRNRPYGLPPCERALPSARAG